MVEIDPKQAEQSALEAAQKRLKSMEQRLLALELRKPPASLQENELFSSGGWTFRPRAAASTLVPEFAAITAYTATTLTVYPFAPLWMGQTEFAVSGSGEFTISANTYIYFAIDRHGGVTLTSATSAPTNTDSVHNVILYYIAFSSGAINWAGSVDYRFNHYVHLWA